MSFSPATAGPNSGSLVLTDNNLNASLTQTLALYGTTQNSQSISFSPPSTVTYGVTPITLSATGGASNNPVIFSIVSGPGTLSGPDDSILTVTGAGTIVVSALQAGNANYAPAQTTASIVVSMATPGLTWANPAALVYGTPLGATQLNPIVIFGSSIIAGSFTYTATPAGGSATAVSSGSVLTAGSYTLTATFTPTDTTDYTSATKTVSLTVSQTTPTLTWAAPATISYGTALSSTQLNANSGGVAGTFVYSPAAGATPAVGTDALSVTFTPTDATDYASATKTVSLTVQDFSLPAAPAAVTVTAGQTATASLIVSSMSGFAGTVVFTCSVPASMSEASCSATSAQITASSGASSTLTVNTTAAHTVASSARPGRWMASRIGAVFAGFILLGVPKVKRRRAGLLALFILLLLLLGITSCGGSSSGSGSTGGKQMDAGTPAGTYSLTLTAASGTASHTMNVSVTVQ